MNVTELITEFSNITSHDEDDHDHDHDTGVNLAKGITMLILFLISMCSGMMPLLLAKCFKWSDPNRDPRTNLIVSSLLSFGGGALLCTTFMHLLPEIDENITELQHDGRLPEWEFSITNLLMAVGFFIIYLVEEIVHAYLRKHQKRQAQAQDAFMRGHSARESLRAAALRNNHENSEAKNGIITVSTADLIDNDQLHHHNHHQHSHSHSHNHHHHSHIPVKF
jgi:zinc transporter 1/2/3